MKDIRFVRAAGLSCIIGGVILFGSAIGLALFPPERGTTAFIVANILTQVGYLFVFIGLVGLVRSRAAGTGWLAKIGLSLALLACVLFILSESVFLFQPALGVMLLVIFEVLLAVGMLLSGSSVLRNRRWQRWHRFIPLLFGLYHFLVTIPAFVITGGPNFWAISGQNLWWILLGVALQVEAGNQQMVQPSLPN